jgi:hypothetical protein
MVHKRNKLHVLNAVKRDIMQIIVTVKKVIMIIHLMIIFQMIIDLYIHYMV